MHGHCGLAGTGHPLDDDVVIRGFAYDVVLLFLDGGDDLSQDSLLVFCQVFCQQFVVGHHLAVVVIQKLSVLDLICALQLQVDGNLSVSRGGVAASAQTVFIVCVCHRRPPVDHSLAGGVPGNASFADVDALILLQHLVVKVNPAEIGFVPSPLVPFQGTLHLVVQRHAVLQEIDQLRVVIVKMVEHVVDFFPHPGYLSAVVFQVFMDDGKGLFQELLLRLPGCAL